MRELQKDLEICNKATPGPWVWGENTLIGGYWVQEYHGHPESSLADFVNSNDAEFIADARNGWPEAIERAIAAEAEVERLNKICESCPEFGNINFSVELARTKRALELAIKNIENGSWGEYPLGDQRWVDYFLEQAEKEGDA